VTSVGPGQWARWLPQSILHNLSTLLVVIISARLIGYDPED
jgi:hypothetical protein